MPDAPEIPEASNPFDKRVALTIAIIAVILSFVENHGDNAKTDLIVKTNEASNRWAYFQSKSIKGSMTEVHASILGAMQSPNAEATAAEIKTLNEKSARYESEKEEIKKAAEEFEVIAKKKGEVDDRCDMSALFLQVAVVICSVAILAHIVALWYVGIGLATAGTIVAITAFLM